MELSAKAITPEFVNFIEKNVRTNPGKATLKFNIVEPKENLKFTLRTFEKGFNLNEEFVQFIDNNNDIEVKVIST